MVGSRFLRGVLGVLIAMTLSRCTSGPPPPTDSRPYEEQILSARAQKDADFRATANQYSPIPMVERGSFPGLAYYPVQPEFRVPAALTEVTSDPPIVMALTNTAQQIEKKVKVGTLAFTVAGKPFVLSAFAENRGNVQRLWVPFRDLTSGIETYGGGRYLDLDRTASGAYDLDFNRAYHPFCVYDPSWVCPYPPSENRLPVAIRAGERLAEVKAGQ